MIKEVPKETIKEVPVEVIKEVIVQSPYEVIKEIEVEKEVIREVCSLSLPAAAHVRATCHTSRRVKADERMQCLLLSPQVPVEVIKEVEKLVYTEAPPREIIKYVDREVIKEVPVEVIKFVDREVR